MLVWLKLVRLKQWIKNIFVLPPLFFSFQFYFLQSWIKAAIAIFIFILISSSIYIINDISDKNEDQKHPKKKNRPIASRKIKSLHAGLLSISLIIIAFYSLRFLPQQCLIVVLSYFVIQIFYTFSLKHHAIFDVLVIASGFVLRILMGAYAIEVPVSPWIILTTYLLALFLGFGKRYNEFLIEDYKKSRNSLDNYNKEFLTSLIIISCTASLMSYSLYAVEMARIIEKTEFVYTVIFVIFGLFRYLQIIYVNNDSGEPDRAIYHDKIFFLNGLIWFLVTLYLLT